MSTSREGVTTLTPDERAVARLQLLHAATGRPAPNRARRRAAIAAARRGQRTQRLNGWDQLGYSTDTNGQDEQ